MADRYTLAELKKMIKEHTKTAPKLSAGKQNLLLYAERAGLLKSKEVVSQQGPPPITPRGPVRKAPEVMPPAKRPLKSELPAELKRPVKAEPVKKSPSGFAKFLSDYKGQGYTMTELSQLYKESKNVEQ
jgi:hypothetical protein